MSIVGSKILKGECHEYDNPLLLTLVEDVSAALAEKQLVVAVTGAEVRTSLLDCHPQ